MKNEITALKPFLDQKADQYNNRQFIPADPVSVPHLFSKKEDIEIAGFLAAVIAWGRRSTIVANASRLVQWMDYAPHHFILDFTDRDLAPFRHFVHRTFNGEDCEFFMWSLKNIYQNHGGLEQAFSGGEPINDAGEAILRFRSIFFEQEHPQRTEKHLANPAKKASAKRINMFLRWMVRRDDKGVDFGIWKSIPPARLICPLDVHVAATARRLALLRRKANDWQAALELTQNLRLLNADDPVRYDYALFGLGVFEGMK